MTISPGSGPVAAVAAVAGRAFGGCGPHAPIDGGCGPRTPSGELAGWGLWRTSPDRRGLWTTSPGVRDALEGAVFHEGAQVLGGGFPELLAQADDQRLGELEEPAALAAAGGGDAGPFRGRLQYRVGLQVERPVGHLGGEVLVLGQAGAYRARLVVPAQERSPVAKGGTHLERAVARDARLGQARHPQRSPLHVHQDGEDVLDRAADDGDDRELVHDSCLLARRATEGHVTERSLLHRYGKSRLMSK